MDVLVADDDNFVSLEEALAFIDGYDIADQSFTDTLVGHCYPIDWINPVSPSELLTPKATRATKAPARTSARKHGESEPELSPSLDQKSTKKRRTRSAASSSTRLQQLKRAEIRALREEAQELEAQVEVLKKNKCLPGGVVPGLDTAHDGASKANLVNWHEMAIAQYRDRFLSEKTNRRLKSILSNQEKVNGALSGLLQKRTVLHGMNYMLSTKSSMESPLLTGARSADSHAAGTVKIEVLNELEEVVKQIYNEAKAKLSQSRPSPVISCDMRIKHDARRGKMIEFITTTPMSCSVKSATDILWKELTPFREHPDKVYNYIRGDNPNTQEKNFVISLQSPSGVLELNGVQYIKKFEEKERSIFAVAERMVLSTKSLRYRVESWITVSPSGNDANASVVEIFLQLYMELDYEHVASREDLAYAQNIVMGSLSNMFRKSVLAQQNALMEKAGCI